MSENTYLARGYCTNCGKENYPQWGTYNMGTLISDILCPKCGCQTWVKDDRDHSPTSNSQGGTK